MRATRRLALILLATLPLAARAQGSVTVEGLVFADSVPVAGAEVRLNGTGIREVAWFKGYVAGLYLTSRASTAQQAVDVPGPKRIEMRMLQDVPAEEFSKALRKGISRNCTPAQLAAVDTRMESFARQIDAMREVRKGDVVDLDLDPARGLLFSVNGRSRGQPIPGEDFYAALLRAFVGEYPYDKKLRDGLLGRPT